jgi:hypothetical protein
MSLIASPRRRRVPFRRLALAGVGAVLASGLLASSALASPTGSITVGPRISTGQLTAQFSATSDLVDDSGFGFERSWFAKATLAAPGESCIASSSAVKYVGRFMDGPGSDNSDTEAFYADAGTLCLWVSAGDDNYLVATAAVAPEPAPAPAPTPTDSPQPLSISKARSAALAKAKQLWKARKPKAVSVRRTSSSTVTVRVMWRKSGTKQIRTMKVTRTRLGGIKAVAA